MEEEWRVKLAGDFDWVPAKYMDDAMKVLRGVQWVTGLRWSSGRTKLFVLPSPR